MTVGKRTIVAFDPGNHCGISWRNADNTLDAVMIYENIPLTFKFILDHPKIVVYEDFEAQHIGKYGLYTVRLIGGIEALCWSLGIPCVKHIPQARYAFLDDAEAYLRKLRGKRRFVVHEKDAMAHLLAFEARQANILAHSLKQASAQPQHTQATRPNPFKKESLSYAHSSPTSSRKVPNGSSRSSTSPQAIANKLRQNTPEFKTD